MPRRMLAFLANTDTTAQIAANTVGHTVIPMGILATWLGYLPAVGAALVTTLGAIFYAIQIYESNTFQHWRSNHLMKRKARKLAKLRAKEKLVLAKIEALQTLKVARVEAQRVLSVAQADAAKIAAKSPVEIAEKQNPTI